MISESQQEQACLYVLGMLAPAEATEFEQQLQGDPALQKLVTELNNAAVAIAQSAPHKPLPTELKTKLLAALAAKQEVIPFPAAKSNWLPWAVAACLAGYAGWQWNTATQTQKRSTEELIAKSAQIESLRSKQTQLETEKMAAEVARANWEKRHAEAIQQLTASTTDKAALQARVASLEQRDFLAQAQIAVMGSLLKDQPKAVAVSVWDQQKQNGVLVVENMPVLARGRDYQLWVLDPSVAAPVSAGVFKVDKDGKVRITFKPTTATPNAAKFAVTEEKEGGVASPTMEKMVVIGGI